MLVRVARTGTISIAMVSLLASAGVAQQPAVCTANCAQLIVSPTPPSGGTVPVTITFNQGPGNGVPNQGNGQTAAIAFTLGIPGVGSSTPLSLTDCTVNSDGLTSSFNVPGAISSTFAVVIENLSCTTLTGSSRTHCLCPGTGQTQDNYINVVVYGPKTLPSSGPVTIPVLPSGQLMTINLTQNSTTKTALHVFAQTDNQTTEPKPQFGAYLSIGDVSAIDQTFNQATNTSQVQIVNASEGSSCVGDCTGVNMVSVADLVKGVNIALGLAPLSTCSAFDADGNGMVSVNELVQGVNNALNGCPS